MPIRKRRDARFCSKQCQENDYHAAKRARIKADAQASLLVLNRNDNGGSRGPKPRIDPALTSAIASLIMRGWEPHVAAQACGVKYETWRSWMKKGEKAKTGVYADFYMAMVRTKNYARGTAAEDVRAAQPLQWLRHVHKERPGDDQPGWSDTSSVPGGGEGKAALVDLLKVIRGEPESEAK